MNRPQHFAVENVAPQPLDCRADPLGLTYGDLPMIGWMLSLLQLMRLKVSKCLHPAVPATGSLETIIR